MGCRSVLNALLRLHFCELASKVIGCFCDKGVDMRQMLFVVAIISLAYSRATALDLSPSSASFLSEYTEATDKFNAAYAGLVVQANIDRKNYPSSFDTNQLFAEATLYSRNGALQMQSVFKDGRKVVSSTDTRQSFTIERQKDSERYAIMSIEGDEDAEMAIVIRDEQLIPFASYCLFGETILSLLRHEGLERLSVVNEDGDKRILRVDYSILIHSKPQTRSQGWVRLDSTKNLAVIESWFGGKTDGWRTLIEYAEETIDGVPFPKSVKHWREKDGQRSLEYLASLESISTKAPDEALFKLSSFGLPDIPANGPTVFENPSSMIVFIGANCIVLAIVLIVIARVRKQAS